MSTSKHTADEAKLPEGGRANRFWRGVFKLGVGLAGLGALLAAWSWVLAYLSTHPPRRQVRGTPLDHDIEFEDLSFFSRDGLRLAGWFLPSPGARAGIILCHGFPNNRSEMMEWARALHAAGYSILMFDFRALGQSEGNLCSIGFHEVEDLLGAVDYMTRRPETAGLPLGVFGLSMGGAVALMAAARDERIAAVATHGAYASLDRAITQRCRMYLGPLGPMAAKPVTWWGRRWFSFDPRHMSLVNVVGAIAPRPVLLFHGGRDLIVNPNDARDLYAAAQEPKQLHWLPRSWHGSVHADELAGYATALLDFFERSLVRQ